MSSFFAGREGPPAPPWGGAPGGGLHCVPPRVHHGWLHQPSVHIRGADDNHQLHQDRGHSGGADLHQGCGLELLPQVGSHVISSSCMFKLVVWILNNILHSTSIKMVLQWLWYFAWKILICCFSVNRFDVVFSSPEPKAPREDNYEIVKKHW